MSERPAVRPPSVVNRLLIAQIAPLAIVAVVLLAVGAWTAHRVVERTSDRLLAGSMQAIRESVSVENGRVTADVAPWSLALLDGPERDAVYYSVREGARLVTGYAELPELDNAASEQPAFADLTVRGVRVRMAQQTLVIPGRTAPIVVSVAQSLDSRRANLRELHRNLLILPALLVVLAALLVWPAVQWSLNSLRRLVDDLSARSASAGAGFAPAPVGLAPRELAPVLTAFNRLLASLERSSSGMQRFAADASHQLRTPLTVLSANLDLLAVSSHDRSATERRLLADSRAAATGMTRLIQQLLSTARADGAHVETTADLARAVRRAYKTVSQSRSLPASAVRLRTPVESLMVRGDEDLIAEQVVNLVDNALRHGRAPVVVYVRADRDRGMIAVWDHGDGVDDADLPHLADRFFRARPDLADSTGLGLSIVQTLAIAQGGALTISNRRRGGLVASLLFDRRG